MSPPPIPAVKKTAPLTNIDEMVFDAEQIRLEVEQLAAALKKYPAGYAIVIFKESRLLYLAKNGQVVEGLFVCKSEIDPASRFLKGKPADKIRLDFPVAIALGRDPVGSKQKKGDNKTPEGEYRVCLKKPRSQFTAALEISYPSLRDAEAAMREKRISPRYYDALKRKLTANPCLARDSALGGDIQIHGPASERYNKTFLARDNFGADYDGGENWTFGCVALNRLAILYLQKVVPNKTPVIIYP